MLQRGLLSLNLVNQPLRTSNFELLFCSLLASLSLPRIEESWGPALDQELVELINTLINVSGILRKLVA